MTLDEIAKKATTSRPDRAAMARLAQRRSELLPIEKPATLDALDMKLYREDAGTPELDAIYPRIDMEFVTGLLKRQKGVPFAVPQFAVLDIEQPGTLIKAFSSIRGQEMQYNSTCSLSLYGNKSLNILFGALDKSMKAGHARVWKSFQFKVRALLIGVIVACIGLSVAAVVMDWRADIHVIPAIASIFAGLALLASIKAQDFWPGSSYNTSLEYKLSATIPNDDRKIIIAARQKFQNVLLVTEAEQWSFDSQMVPAPRNLDPLVVGHHNGAYYLVHKFNLTPTEKWLSGEALQ